MRLGILNAFPADGEIIDWGSGPSDWYAAFLAQAAPKEFSHAGFDVAEGEFPAAVSDCDAWLVTGSPHGTYEDLPWIAQLEQFVRDAVADNRKVVGICFGHQLLAQAFGGESLKSEKGYGLGLMPFDLTAQTTWMPDNREQCSLYYVHQDHVTRLPDGAQHLGGSDFCPNAMFTLGEHVLGIQGHPEFNRKIMQDLFNSGQIGAEAATLAAGQRSLDEGEPDNSLVASWIMNFLLADKITNRKDH